MDSINMQLDENSPIAQQPNGISLNLKYHQLVSLHRMKMIDQDCGMYMKSLGINFKGNVGILADLAGYGKTLTFLSLVKSFKNTNTINNISGAPSNYLLYEDYYLINEKENNTPIKTTLIVVPNNILNQWEKHLNDYTSLSYETVQLVNIYNICIEEYDVILCPASVYNSFLNRLPNIFWNRVAFDEADSINIPNTSYIKSRFLWLITSTYNNLFYRTNRGFLRELCNYKLLQLCERFPIVIKCNDEFVKKSFNIPEPLIEYIICETPSFVNIVRNIVDDRILRLINAGNVNMAIKLLGGHVDTDKNIIELVTKKLNEDIQTSHLKIEELKRKLLVFKSKNKINTLEQELCFLKEKKERLENSINNVERNDCSICYDILSHPTMVECCNNIFCGGCLLKWINNHNTCPLCRSNLNTKMFKCISNTPLSMNVNNDKIKKGKIDTILDLIEKNPEGRFLIFSSHTETFRDIKLKLNLKNIKFGMLTKSIRTVDNTLEKFRTKQISIILLNAQYNGAGIEISDATDVILCHKMNKGIETQAISRAQRPGRTGRLNVWKLRYENEGIN